MRGLFLGATLLAVLLAPPPAPAQSRGGAGDAAADRAFVEALRRDDPAAAERFVALRDARARAIAELQRLETQYGNAGGELRPVFLPQLRRARRTYAEASLALLDFLDAHDRRTLADYRQAIDRINGILEERKQSRAQLEKLLQE